MNKMILIIVLLMASAGLNAQAFKSAVQQSHWPVVFDNFWKVAEVPKAPMYYRDFKPFSDNRSGGFVRDYYISGKLQWDGTISNNLTSANPDDYIKEGIFTWYYENGNVSVISFFRNNKLEGQRSAFSEDGKLVEEAFYKSDKIHGYYKSYHKDGKPWFVAEYNNGLLVDNFAEEFLENGTRATVYVENFVSATNSYSWPLGDYGTYSAKIEANTGLKMTDPDNERLGFHLKKPQILTGTPFFFSCRVSSISGNKGSYYGLTFDFIDWENYKYFLISDNGNYAVGKYVKGSNVYTVSPAYSDAIKKRQEIGDYYYDNVNNLEVSTIDGNTTFTINGKIAFSTRSFLEGNGMMGLYIESGKKTVTFNQFIIKAK